ncbi:MAG TPA: peptidylprolyl isomerase [Candidatus Obscuribacterales bacterium]
MRAPHSVIIVQLLLIVICSLPAFAEKTDPSLIPPDVTLPSGSTTTSTATTPAVTPPPADTPAPGMQGAAATSGTAPGTGFSPQGAGGPQPPPQGSTLKGYAGKSGPATVWPQGAPPAANQDNRPDPLCVIETNKGVITIRLFRKFAPRTVAHFTELVQKGFYNGLTFHRVEPGFVIQGGCPNGNGSGLYIDPQTNKPKMLMFEPSPSLTHNAPGVVAMARFPKNPSSASCQFYITLAPQPRLDGQYNIFGGVISGMDVVHKIAIGDKMLSLSVREQ